MSTKAPMLLILVFLTYLANSAAAQSTTEFLGPSYELKIKYSPKYQIPYRDNGFSEPLERKVKKAKKRGAPLFVLDEIRSFPGTPDAIGRWIDEAFDEAVATFSKCGGPLADFASRISPTSLAGGVTIEPTIWYEPALNAYLAGGYYPDTNSIRVVNIYYGSTGLYRHARSLLKWEMKNHFAFMVGIQSEPTDSDWPCTAR